jgi:DMSO/TMAO reductase YedYZ molybdopterin-dependent catalytic subunit
MGFFERNRSELAERGIDPSRLPPGQYHTDRFPVLHVGEIPQYADDLSDWSLRVWGLVDREVTLSWADLQAMPRHALTADIHCVTKWSKFDTAWEGVRLRDILALAGVRPGATHVVTHAEFGYTANLPLADLLGDDVIVADRYDGEPLAPEHGYPARSLVPKLYLWKSVKWVRGFELLDHDQRGFWEHNGYHDYGDPWLEQRHWGD